MIIAVDGPTASGKGTIARALAAHFGLPHLDTGLLYRAVGRQVFLDGGDRSDEARRYQIQAQLEQIRRVLTLQASHRQNGGAAEAVEQRHALTEKTPLTSTKSFRSFIISSWQADTTAAGTPSAPSAHVHNRIFLANNANCSSCGTSYKLFISATVAQTNSFGTPSAG